MSTRLSALYRAGILSVALGGMVALSGCPIVTTTPPGAGCVPGDARPQCINAGGSLNITWTLNGQPAATACGPANAVNVAITVDNAAPANVPCAHGTFVLPTIALGPHTITANLLDQGNATLSTFPAATVNVVAGTPTILTVGFTTGAAAMVGTIVLPWTVGGQPPATACPANSQVKIESTSTPGGAAAINRDFACNQGTAQLDNLPIGAYTLKLTLNGGATPAPVLENVQATVNQGQTSMVNGLDFPSGGGAQTGSVKLTWTVNAAANCPANALVTVAVSGGPTAVTPAPTVACNSGDGITVPNLAVGTYTFSLTLADPANSANVTPPVDAAGIPVMAGATGSVGPLNIVCTFCPGAGS